MGISVFTVTLTSGQTLPDSGVDLGQSGWQKVVCEVPTCASGSFQWYVSSSETGTYRPLVSQDQTAVYSVNSALIANGCMAEVGGGYQYVKPRNTSGCTDAVKTYKIICSD